MSESNAETQGSAEKVEGDQVVVNESESPSEEPSGDAEGGDGGESDSDD